MMAWLWHPASGPLGNCDGLLHQTCRGSTQFCLGLTIDRLLGLAAVRRAAQHVHARFALLRCAIEERAGALSFREPNGGAQDVAPELRGAATRISGLNALMDAEVSDPLDMRRALWRIAYARAVGPCSYRPDLPIPTFGDRCRRCHEGVASALLGALDELMTSADIDDQPSGELPVAIDGFPHTIDPSADTPVLTVVQTGPRSTGVHHSRISKACWSTFHVPCAHHGVLPNAALSASLMLVMQEAGQERPGMRFRCAVSVRREAHSDGALLGSYVRVADAEPCAPGSTLLDAAKAHQVKLVISMSRSLSSDTGGYGVSNIGQLDMRTRWRHFDVVDLSSAMNMAAGNNHVGLNALLFQGELHLYYCYPSHMICETDVARVEPAKKGYIESLSLKAVTTAQS